MYGNGAGIGLAIIQEARSLPFTAHPLDLSEFTAAAAGTVRPRACARPTEASLTEFRQTETTLWAFASRGIWNKKLKKLFLYLSLLTVAGAVLIGCKTPPRASEPEKKFALVIGNSNYGAYAKLKNSINDAEDMSKVLQELDYKVELCIDIDLDEMKAVIDNFAENLSKREDAEGFFYFAGMGARIKGKNYIIPTAIKASNEDQLILGSYELSDLFGKLIEADNAVNVVIIDACFSEISSGEHRNTAPQTARSASIGDVISSDKINNDSLELIEQFSKDIFYFQSALPGKEALDGMGRNSPFTRALLENIAKPAMFTDLVQEIIKDTHKHSGGSQRPYFKANVFNYRDYMLNR